MAHQEVKSFTGKSFASITEASQADNEHVVKTPQATNLDKWQLQVCVSETPTAGDLEVAIYSPGAQDLVVIETIDLTQCPVLSTYSYVFDQIVFTPTNFDSDKTYSLVLNGWQG